MEEKEIKWKEYCKYCKRFHITKMRACPSCGTYETPQPASDKVYELCKAPMTYYQCDGCEAYNDHLQ